MRKSFRFRNKNLQPGRLQFNSLRTIIKLYILETPADLRAYERAEPTVVHSSPTLSIVAPDSRNLTRMRVQRISSKE